MARKVQIQRLRKEELGVGVGAVEGGVEGASLELEEGGLRDERAGGDEADAGFFDGGCGVGAIGGEGKLGKEGGEVGWGRAGRGRTGTSVAVQASTEDRTRIETPSLKSDQKLLETLMRLTHVGDDSVVSRSDLTPAASGALVIPSTKLFGVAPSLTLGSHLTIRRVSPTTSTSILISLSAMPPVQRRSLRTVFRQQTTSTAWKSNSGEQCLVATMKGTRGDVGLRAVLWSMNWGFESRVKVTERARFFKREGTL